MGYGDRLASGGRSATFSAAPPMSQEKWDAMWETTTTVISNYEHPKEGHRVYFNEEFGSGPHLSEE